MTESVIMGKLVIFEGIDGAGKTTLAARVVEELKRENVRVQKVSEPGGTPMGEHLREMLLANDVSLTPDEMTLMFTLQRQYLMRTRVAPAIEQGATVVSDRSILSTLVYQNEQGVRVDRILDVSREVLESLHWIPKQVFVLDLEPSIAMERTQNVDATRTINHFDTASFEVYAKRRKHYLRAADILNWRACILDATRTVDELVQDVLGKLDEQ